MAVKKNKKAEEPVVAGVAKVAEVKNDFEEEKLDPQEEKILDWILKGVVGFILAWLGLSILMVIGGLFHLWG